MKKGVKTEAIKSKTFLYVTAGLFLLTIISSAFLELKLLLVLLFASLLLTSYLLYKVKVGQEMIIAFLFAVIISSYYTYEYTTANLLLGKINLFPLVSWTFGLVLTREFYELLNIKYKLALTVIVYIVALLVFEYIGYNFLSIQLNSSYSGLLGMELIHGPLGMKLFYLLAGPVYLLITDYLKVK